MVYPFWKYVVGPVYKLWLKGIKGVGNIPRNGQFIVAANHSSYYDALLIPFILFPILDKKTHALVSSMYWKIPIVGQVLSHGECIPVYIKNEKNADKKNMEALGTAVGYLEKKEIVFMFPEGARSHDGKLRKAKTGIARLVLMSKAPVVPFGIIDSHKVLAKGKMLPRFRRCEVRIGKPMHFESYYKKRMSKKVLEEVTSKIMKEVAKLSNQKYNY